MDNSGRALAISVWPVSERHSVAHSGHRRIAGREEKACVFNGGRPAPAGIGIAQSKPN